MVKKLLLPLTAGILFFGCEKKQEVPVQEERFLFGTYIKIVAYGKNEKSAKLAIEKAFDEIKRIDNAYNSKDENSQIYALNRSLNKEIKIDEEGRYLFDRVRYMYELSHGKYDVTISPLMNVWGFDLGEKGSLPTEEELRKAMSRVDFSKVKMDGDRVKIDSPDVEVDTGSFLKGYAIQRAKETMESQGIKSAFITAISSIETIGTKPNGTPWKIGLQNPAYPEEILGVIELKGMGMGVSGDYQTYVEIDGKRYHHILDKGTGYPVADKKMVAVICDDSFMADMYSTAFYSMPTNEVMQYVENRQGLDVLIVDSDGGIVKSSKFDISLRN